MNTTLPMSAALNSNPSVEPCKAAILRVADHWLALPVTALLKVTSATTLPNTEILAGQLSLWDDRPLVGLDLHQLLACLNTPAADEPPQEMNPHPYVVIAWSQTGDRCAIPVDTLPILLDLPLAQAQLLPPHYRQTIKNIARYMVVLPHQGSVVTVLLLDLQQALSRTTLRNSPAKL